jgi:RimJ/RimL family protein N-acetyltransferase
MAERTEPVSPAAGPPVPVPPRLVEHVRLPDGRRVTLRPLLPGDELAYRRFTRTVSPRSQYYRFFTPRKELSEREIDHFLHVDFVDRYALVAVHGDDVVAVARFDREPGTDEAEVAFIVRDDFQRQGIAPRLLRLLAVPARRSGIACFTATVLPDNAPMLAVFAASGWQTARHFDGEEVSVVLTLA